MTTTGAEPVQDPDQQPIIEPDGDPDLELERGDPPGTRREGAPQAAPKEQLGQMPESTNTEVGA